MDAMIMPRGHPVDRRLHWTVEQKKVVRDYWMLGYSALWIGNKLGKTRRSIIGLVWRMGLVRVERPVNPAPVPTRKGFIPWNKGTTGRKPIRAILGQKRSDGQPLTLKDVPMPTPSVAAKTAYDPKTLLQLKSNDCRFPVGDPQSSAFRYCGAQRQEPGPYCRIHTAITLYSTKR